jgi:ceramide glucosyltransferase
MKILGDATAIVTGLGLLQCLFGLIAVVRFAARRRAAPLTFPSVTILKPLFGGEPFLEEGLVSSCRQIYPEFQIVFGIQDAADIALSAARRVQQKFPHIDIDIVVNPTLHGSNRKVSNLINMLAAARHDVLVICDSDLHVPSDYLERLATALERSGTGLVTAAFVGRSALPGWVGKLGATHMNHTFLPGLLLARALGRRDCMGSTVMLRRDTLERIGGLQAFASYLAEDNVLGQHVCKLGLDIGLADAVPVATVPETSVRALWSHEIRWMRTIRWLAPFALAASILQYPLFWAALTIGFSAGTAWSVALFAGSWLVRAASALGIDYSLACRTGGLATTTPIALLPLRDILSVVEVVMSYMSDKVIWRANEMSVRHPQPSRLL